MQAAAPITGGTIASGPTAPPLGTAAATSETAAQPLLIAVLGAAFVGGLILNLMPCVLPVLSLKVFSLMKHAGENKGAAWIQGVAFTAGVVISFWLLAGLLLILRSAGNHLGWGFQMQSPGFVLGLILLFFLLGLNLFGVFELGASLVGLDAKAAGKLDGTASSFGNGALATLAATPCTAPFIGLGARIRGAAAGLYFALYLHVSRAWDGVSLPAPHHFSGCASLCAEAGRVDGIVQAIHGISADGNGDFSRLCFWRAGR